MTTPYQEWPATIPVGRVATLVAVVTQPVAPSATPRPIVLLANVGMYRRVGPFRWYTDLARALACEGFTTIRFDHAGLGDSDASRDNRNDRERAVDEARAVLDWAGTHARIGGGSATTGVVVGLCSGADKAHAMGVAEPRIVGLCFLEGYAYRTPGFHIRRGMLRYLEPQLWRSYLARRRSDGKGPAQANVVLDAYVQFPPRETAAREIAAMLERGAKLLFVYTGGAKLWFNHVGQFDAMYPEVARSPKRAACDVSLYSSMDHTLSMVADRERVTERVVNWMRGSWPGK
jgi:hypothetical protein